MSNTPKSPQYVTTRDIVIPAGTLVGQAPDRTTHYTPHGSILVAINKDATADIRFDLDDALQDGLVKEITP